MEAFAEFRAAIVARGALTEQQAEALLRGVTRRAAASRGANTLAAGRGGPDSADCDGREIDLLGYVEDALSPADREDRAAHVARCSACTRAHGWLEAGERAFKLPPKVALPARVADEIARVLAPAAPVPVCDGEAFRVRDEAPRPLDRDARGAAPTLGATAADGVPLRPVSEQRLAPAPGADSARRVRLPDQPWLDFRAYHHHRRALRLLHNAARLIAVVVLAGVIGVLLGWGIAAL